MSEPFAAYVWIAYGVSLAGLAGMIAVTLVRYVKAKKAVNDWETKP